MPWEKPGASGEEIAEGITADVLIGPLLEIIRRSENSSGGCGTTGSNWNHGGCYYSHYLCCKASSDYQPNSACSGVFQNGGWYRAC